MTLSTTALAHYDAPKLIAALERAQARIRELEAEVGRLHQEVKWRDQLDAVPATVMSPSQKATLRAAVKAYQQGTPDENSLVQIESWKLCKTVGQSRQTFLDNLTYCAEKLGILTKKRERVVESDTNDYSTNLYIGITPLLAHPQQYQVEQPRNHGGERERCPHCHSDRLQRKVTMTCMNCGSILEEKISLVNQGSHLDVSPDSQVDHEASEHTQVDQEPTRDTNVNLTAIKTNVLTSQLDDSALLPQEPTTPPIVDRDSSLNQHEQERQAQPVDSRDLVRQAAQLLVDMAGPEAVHIEMSARGPKKYYPVCRALTVQDARAHLKGWKTKGAYLRHPDGMTRALCYDADTADTWEHLLDAARFLAEAGYRVLVEDSPAGRGGHLWIIYTGLVNAAWAHRHALEVAPMLHHIKEAWPGPGSNKVRLPGGKYVKPGFAAWCKLHDAHGARLAEDGQEAARALLDYQTPVEIVPAYSEPGYAGQDDELVSLPNNDDQAQASNTPFVALRKTPGVDQRWQQKYRPHLWFHFTPAMLANWYNERNHVCDLLPLEQNGMGLASWRGERTASVGLREEGWVDFGASALREDGKLEAKLDLGDLDKLGANIGYGVPRADGVVLDGYLNAVAAAVGTMHAPVFDPNGEQPGGNVIADDLLFGTWSSGHNCDTGWHAAFELPKIHIRNKVIDQGSGNTVLDQPVAVFDTSWTRPSKHWSIEKPATKIDQYVTVTGDIAVYTHSDDPPADNRFGIENSPIFHSEGRVFLHTDAGLRQYKIGRIPPPPKPPSLDQMLVMQVNCKKLVHQLDDIHWLVDPPDFDYGYAPLRHWTINVPRALAGTRIDLSGVQSGLPPQTIASTMVEQTGPVSIEVVTDPRTELRITHDHADSLADVRISQQWLLPTTTTPAAGMPSRLLLDGDQVVATAAPVTISITTGDDGSADSSPPPPPASLTLPDGRVAAWHNDQLILAYPFGGAATPQ